MSGRILGFVSIFLSILSLLCFVRLIMSALFAFVTKNEKNW